MPTPYNCEVRASVPKTRPDFPFLRPSYDHPVCVECTEMLVAELQRRLESATKERDAYVGFLKQVHSEIPTEEEVKESQEALAEARAEEDAAIQELKKLEAE